MKYADARIMVFSKAPDPGRVKTRLIATIGEDAAAELYRDLVHATLETAAGSGLCPVELWCSPGVSHPFFEQCRQQHGVELHAQIQGDLGRRMSHALQSSGRPGRSLVLVGADCPTLSAADLEEAFTLLEQDNGVVLGPAEDGGYYLIGMREPCAFIFDDIPWGASTVLELTRARLRQRRIKCQCLTLRRDLDTADDYRAYLESGGNVRKRAPGRSPAGIKTF